MRTPIVIGIAVGILGILNMSALAQQLIEPSTATEFSGRDGTNETLSKQASANDAIFGVEAAERSDDPCFLEVRYKDVETGQEEVSRRFAECSDNNNDEGTSRSRRVVLLPDGVLATGVRICLNSKRNKLKGLELIGTYGACLLGHDRAFVTRGPCTNVINFGGMDYRLCNTDGRPTYDEVDCNGSSGVVRKYFERTNCDGTQNGPDKDWEVKVSCGPRTVATGMRLSTRNGGGNRVMIDGVALDCHRVGGSN